MFFMTKDKIELKVIGMSCGHCEVKTQEAVAKLPGVKKVTASRAGEKVTIEPEKAAALDLEKIKETIKSLGYQVTE